MTDVLGQAIWDYFDTDKEATLWVHDVLGPQVEMPVEVYYRDYEEMPALEQFCLAQCYGDILDIGAGAGSHAIALEMRGYKVDALDISPLACKTMRARGADNVICADIFAYSGKQYDTIMMLMNGLGFCGELDQVGTFLEHAKTLLKEDGQILFDSSDVAYLYEDDELPKPNHYYGEIKCRYEYDGQFSEWFKWLYVDKDTMYDIAEKHGFRMQVLTEDETGQYLAVLKMK